MNLTRKTQLLRVLNRLVDGVQFSWRKSKRDNLTDEEINLHLKNQQPVFFLSTGRCGTALFTQLISRDKSVSCFHEPLPHLNEESLYAWQSFSKGKELKESRLNHIFTAVRRHYLCKSVLYNKRYIETNHNITFFAPAIEETLTNPIFIHIFRHPGEFIRSGMRRGWYTGKHRFDSGRLKPYKGHEAMSSWPLFSAEQKIAWLWNETNGFIDTFLENIPDNRKFHLNFNNLNVDNAEELVRFLDLSIPTEIIAKTLSKSINRQKIGNYPVYGEWSMDLKSKIMNICVNLMKKYGYSF